MRTLRTTLALALAVASLASVPGRASAQDAAPVLQEDPRAARFRDVERGFFMGFEVGYLSFAKTPVVDRNRFPYVCPSSQATCDGGGASGGLLVGANAGVDLGRHLALSLFFLGGNERASLDYGAFSVYVAGLDARVSFLSLKDRNGFERFYAYVHGRAGLARTYPSGLFGDQDTYAAAGLGFEYFTHLRHFSVGLALDGAYATKAKSAGYALYPTVRYTF